MTASAGQDSLDQGGAVVLVLGSGPAVDEVEPVRREVDHVDVTATGSGVSGRFGQRSVQPARRRDAAEDRGDSSHEPPPPNAWPSRLRETVSWT